GPTRNEGASFEALLRDRRQVARRDRDPEQRDVDGVRVLDGDGDEAARGHAGRVAHVDCAGQAELALVERPGRVLDRRPRVVEGAGAESYDDGLPRAGA